MPPIYEKSVKELFCDFVKSFKPPSSEGFGLVSRKPLDQGGYFTKKEILAWFQAKYPKIQRLTIDAHLSMMSTNVPARLHHRLRPNGADDLLFRLDPQNFRLYQKESDPPPLYKQSEVVGETVSEETEEPQTSSEFAYEQDLQNFLEKNLHLIEPGLKVYDEEGVSGIEFDAGGRFIDILAVAPNGDFVVIELKVSRGYDRVVGQLMRYMAWVKKNLTGQGQKVRGVILAQNISLDLQLACSQVPNVKLLEYVMSFSLKSVALDPAI